MFLNLAVNLVVVNLQIVAAVVEEDVVEEEEDVAEEEIVVAIISASAEDFSFSSSPQMLTINKESEENDSLLSFTLHKLSKQLIKMLLI